MKWSHADVNRDQACREWVAHNVVELHRVYEHVVRYIKLEYEKHRLSLNLPRSNKKQSLPLLRHSIFITAQHRPANGISKLNHVQDNSIEDNGESLR